jgi:hypothetical protein
MWTAVTAQSQSEPWSVKAKSTPTGGLILRASFPRGKKAIVMSDAIRWVLCMGRYFTTDLEVRYETKARVIEKKERTKEKADVL